MIVRSSKRTYILGLPEKLFDRVNTHLQTLGPDELQRYIDENFAKASKLGGKNSQGAWAESRMYRDKAKLAIIVKENYE